MDHSIERSEDAVIVSVKGQVDESNWEAFGAVLGKAIEHTAQLSLATVIINLADLEYMSSRGLRVLTVAKRQGDEAGVAVLLAAPTKVMREILSISRYDKLFTILQIDRQQAISLAR